MRAHVAQFGETDSGHGLLGHSGLDTGTLARLQSHSDRPPGSKSLVRYHAGFPLDDQYVVRYTRPDRQAQRSGFVVTTSLVLDSSIYDAGLTGALEAAAAEPDHDAPITVPSTSSDLSAAGTAIFEAFLDGSQVAWVADDPMSVPAAELWETLNPRDRARLVFGPAASPQTIPYPFTDDPLYLVIVPPEVAHRFDGWKKVGLDGQPRRVSVDDLTGGPTPAGTLLRTLGIERPTLRQWHVLLATSDRARRLDDLTDDDLHALAHGLGQLSPDRSVGVELKHAVVERINSVDEPELRFVRSLRAFPSTAFPSQPEIRALTDAWSSTHMRTDLPVEQAVEAIDLADKDDDVAQALRSSMSQQVQANPGVAATLIVNLVLGGHNDHAGWIARAAGRRTHLDREAASIVTRDTDQRLARFAKSRRWPLLHAATVPIEDPADAWRQHLSLQNNDENSLACLVDRVGPQTTVDLAAAQEGEQLIGPASALVADDPTLMPRPAGPSWWKLWLASIDRGVQPYSVATPADVRDHLLELLRAGGSVSERALRLLIGHADDLTSVPSRSSVWAFLPRPIRPHFLRATAQQIALSGDLDTAALEPELAKTMLTDETLRRIASLSVSSAIDVFEAFQDDLDVQHIRAVIRSARLAPDQARRLGAIVGDLGRSGLATAIAAEVEKRDDLRPAIEESQHLLGFRERLELVVRDLLPSPPKAELHDSLEDVFAELYSRGPNHHDLWSTAGGDPADLLDGDTARIRWRRAIGMINAQHSSAPTLTDLLDEMLREYPNNRKLRWLRDNL